MSSAYNNDKATSGNNNLGYDYQKILPAYISLRLILDKSVTSFKLLLHPKSHNKFDDLRVEIKTKNNETEYFHIQLKYKDRSVLKAKNEFDRKDNINKPKGFNIESYFSKPLNTNIENNFILFTNIKFEDINQVKNSNYSITSVTKPFTSELFNVNGIYKIEKRNPNYTGQKFFLISEQKNINQLEDEIKRIFTTEFLADVKHANSYINFFNHLHNDQYINKELIKNDIILNITQLLLSDFTIKYSTTNKYNEKIQLIEGMINEFDITIVSSLRRNYIEKKWSFILIEQNENLTELAQRLKLLKKNEVLSKTTSQTILNILMKKPVFLEINNFEAFQSVTSIIPLIKSLENMKNIAIKLVLVIDIKNYGTEIYEDVLKNLNKMKNYVTEKCNLNVDVFENLNQIKEVNLVLYEKALETFKISIQGKEAQSIQKLQTEYKLVIDECLTPNEILQFLENDLLIGKKIDAPLRCNRRQLSKNDVSIKYLEDICLQKPTVVNCGKKLNKFEQKIKEKFPKLNLIRIRNVKQNVKHQAPTLIITDQDIQEINNNSYNYLKLLGSDRLQWIDNKICINELLNLQKNLNILSGEPGIGKSTAIKSLFCNSPPNYWIVIVNLQEVNSIFADKYSTDKVIETFIQFSTKTEFDINFCKHLSKLPEKKIIFFLDGLNELNNSWISTAVTTFKEMAAKGYKIWISCTRNLEKHLDNSLDTWSSFIIKGLAKKEQKEYIYNQLQFANIKQTTIDQIIDKIFNMDDTKYIEILEVPLILFILTEILSTDPNLEKIEDIFNSHKLYSSFVDGKVKHTLKKVECEHIDQLQFVIEGFKNYYFKECQIAALETSLDTSIFESLGVKTDEKFLQSIAQNDFIGFIKVKKNNKFVFTHHTFAEYFAANWLLDNFSKIPPENRKFIFEAKYEGIRKFFDTKLAEGCPLHLAILEQDIHKVKNYTKDHISSLDKGGRNVLHLAASIGKRHDIINEEDAKDTSYHMNKSMRSRKAEEILVYLLQINTKLLHQQDLLFGWNVFEYAEAALCLFSLEELSKVNKLKWEYLKIYNKHLYTLSFYCTTMGYLNLLKITVAAIDLRVLEQNHKLSSLLHLAMTFNQRKIIKFLIEFNANTRIVDTQEQTLLHRAAAKGFCDIVILLLKKKNYLEPRDKLGRTPLYIAARMGHLNVVKLLVKKGQKEIDLNSVSTDGTNALHRAAESGFCEIVKFLLENGSDINARDRYKDTALHVATAGGHKNTVKYLLSTKINILAKNENNKTAKDIAFDKGYSELVTILTEAENNLPPSVEEKFPLHIAAKKGDISTIEKLIQKNNINDTNDYKETVLHISACQGNLELVKYLLNLYADTSLVNAEGKTPLHLACHEGHLEIVKKLIEANKSLVLTNDQWGCPPFHQAIYGGHIDIMEELLENGASVNCVCNENLTPFILAASNGHNNVLQWLVEKSCDVNTTTNKKQTCLHLAVLKGKTETVKYLTKNFGKIIDAKDSDGRTPLFLAVDKGNIDTVKVLVEAGANVNALSNFKTSPIDKAREKQHTEILKYLENSNR